MPPFRLPPLQSAIAASPATTAARLAVWQPAFALASSCSLVRPIGHRLLARSSLAGSLVACRWLPGFYSVLGLTPWTHHAHARNKPTTKQSSLTRCILASRIQHSRFAVKFVLSIKLDYHKQMVPLVELLNMILLLQKPKANQRLKSHSCFYPKAAFALVQSESTSTPAFSCFWVKYLE